MTTANRADEPPQGDVGFHGSLIASAPESGYKSVEWMLATARATGLTLSDRIEMPATNPALLWCSENERK